MASKLETLMNEPLGDIRVPNPPRGLYYAKLVGGKINKEATDRKGRTYRRASIVVLLERPTEEMDTALVQEFEAIGEELRLYYDQFIYGAGDMQKLGRVLAKLGADTTKPVSEVLDSLRGSNLACIATVDYRDRDGEPQAEIRGLAAVSA